MGGGGRAIATPSLKFGKVGMPIFFITKYNKQC